MALIYTLLVNLPSPLATLLLHLVSLYSFALSTLSSTLSYLSTSTSNFLSSPSLLFGDLVGLVMYGLMVFLRNLALFTTIIVGVVVYIGFVRLFPDAVAGLKEFFDGKLECGKVPACWKHCPGFIVKVRESLANLIYGEETKVKELRSGRVVMVVDPFEREHKGVEEREGG
jgi:hypothetical protein